MTITCAWSGHLLKQIPMCHFSYRLVAHVWQKYYINLLLSQVWMVWWLTVVTVAVFQIAWWNSYLINMHKVWPSISRCFVWLEQYAGVRSCGLQLLFQVKTFAKTFASGSQQFCPEIFKRWTLVLMRDHKFASGDRCSAVKPTFWNNVCFGLW